MDTGERISFLLERYANNNCSVYEFNELFTLINNSENKKPLQHKLKQLWENNDAKALHTNEEWEVLYTAMMDSSAVVKLKPFSRSLIWQRIFVAAVVLIALTAGLLFYNNKGSKLQIKPQSHVAAHQELAPGGNKAILTLANGSKIVLDGKKYGVLASQTGVKITKAKDGQLIYTLENVNKKPDDQLSYNTIETPKGGQYQISMPDGTKVWLNAMSSLKYPVTFSSKERKVELSGEAYFEVAKNKNAPFKVITNHQEVDVLGTHFNINAYSDETRTKTTLLEGSVKILSMAGKVQGSSGETTILTPGQQSSLTNTGSISIAAIDTELAVAWKNGNFIFNKDDLGGIMRQISRWYDVDVVYSDERIKREVFSGSVSRFENAPEVLDILQLTGLIHFKIEGRRILVTQ